MIRSRNRDDVERGFTLLEILVGLTISSLIMVGLSLTLRSINMGFDSATGTIGRQSSIATGLHIAAQDIARIERAVDHAEKPSRFLFSGRAEELIYVLGERPGNNRAGVYWVRLLVRAGDGGAELVRLRAPFQVGNVEPGLIDWADEVVLLRGDFVIGFSYRAPHSGLRSWASNWEARNLLPEQIKIEIRDLATGRLRVPNFVTTLRIGAEAACVWAEAPGCTLMTDGALSGKVRRQ